MLQILLAFLAISIASITGYGLMEQLHLQQVMLDQRENARRLDTAADALLGRLVALPGMDGVYAPAPFTPATGWSRMPDGVGAINATVDGVPFLYCPLAPQAGTANVDVRLPDDTTYGIEVKSGVVIGSALGNTQALAAGVADFRPVAFIIAANRGWASPPKCGDVALRNGRPFIEHGLVKVVGLPAGAQGVGTIAASASDLYVSQTGSGKGRSASDPASFEDALRQWIAFRPAAMTIHIAEGSTVSVGSAVWTDFLASFSGSPSRLTIEGNNAAISAPGGTAGISSTFSLSGGVSGLAISGPTLVVEQGDELNIQGNVALSPSSAAPVSGLFVSQGGRLNVSGANLQIAGAAVNGVEVSGEMTITSSVVAAPGKTWSVGLASGGRLWSKAGTLGDSSSRNTTAGLAVSGAWSVASDLASQAVAGSGGGCWATLDTNDATFSYSDDGAGLRSSVTSDPAPVVVTDPSDPVQIEAYSTYRREVDGRQRARQTNHSNFLCV